MDGHAKGRVRGLAWSSPPLPPSSLRVLGAAGLSLLLFVAMLPLAPIRAGAAPLVVFSHAGATDPLAASEGWTITPDDAGLVPGMLNAGTSPVEVGPVAPDPSCAGCGLSAWVVDDRSTASATRYRYEQSPTVLQVDDARTLGWALRVQLRVGTGEDAQPGASDPVDASIVAEYSEGTAGGQRRYLLFFGADSLGSPIVELGGDGRQVDTLVDGADYVTFELVYDPVSDSASLFVDGVETLTGYTGVAAGSVQRRVNWGSGSSGGRGRGHFAEVEWQLLLPDLTGVESPPELVDLQILTPIVDTSAGPANVSFQAEITDLGPGVCTGVCDDLGTPTQLQLVQPATGQRQSALFVPSGGDLYSATLILPATSAGGAWQVESIWLADLAGNRAVESATDLVSAGFAIAVSNLSTVGDETPPTLLDLALSASSFDATAGATMTMSISVEQLGSSLCVIGCEGAGGPTQVRYRNAATGQVRDALFSSSGSSFSADVQFLAGSAAGAWRVEWLRLVDVAGNQTILDGTELLGLGFASNLSITSASADSTPPELVSFLSLPDPIDTRTGGLAALFSAELDDPDSGACVDLCDDFGTASQIVYGRDDSDQVRFGLLELVAGDLSSGSFEALVDIPISASEDVWRPRALLLADRAGNRRFVPEPRIGEGLMVALLVLGLLASRAAARRGKRRSAGFAVQL